jgi:hypothetical protein
MVQARKCLSFDIEYTPVDDRLSAIGTKLPIPDVG